MSINGANYFPPPHFPKNDQATLRPKDNPRYIIEKYFEPLPQKPPMDNLEKTYTETTEYSDSAKFSFNLNAAAIAGAISAISGAISGLFSGTAEGTVNPEKKEDQ